MELFSIKIRCTFQLVSTGQTRVILLKSIIMIYATCQAKVPDTLQ